MPLTVYHTTQVYVLDLKIQRTKMDQSGLLIVSRRGRAEEER